jgi:hypothetical protein
MVTPDRALNARPAAADWWLPSPRKTVVGPNVAVLLSAQWRGQGEKAVNDD